MRPLGRVFSCCFGAPAERPDEPLLEGLMDDSTPQIDAQIVWLMQHLHVLHHAADGQSCEALIDAAAQLRELSLSAQQIRPPFCALACHRATHRATLQLTHGDRFLAEGQFVKALMCFNRAKRLGAWQAGLMGLQLTAVGIENAARAASFAQIQPSPVLAAIRTSIFEVREDASGVRAGSSVASSLDRYMGRMIPGFFSVPATPQSGSPARSAAISQALQRCSPRNVGGVHRGAVPADDGIAKTPI